MITLVYENYEQYQKALKRRRIFRFRLSDKVKTIDGQVGTIRRKHRIWPNLPKDWMNGLSQEVRDTIGTDSIFRPNEQIYRRMFEKWGLCLCSLRCGYQPICHSCVRLFNFSVKNVHEASGEPVPASKAIH